MPTTWLLRRGPRWTGIRHGARPAEGDLPQWPCDALGSLACVAALLGMTAGTLYQKRFCAGMDLRTGGAVQFTAAALATGPLALLSEDTRVG